MNPELKRYLEKMGAKGGKARARKYSPADLSKFAHKAWRTRRQKRNGA